MLALGTTYTFLFLARDNTTLGEYTEKRQTAKLKHRNSDVPSSVLNLSG